MIDVSIKTVNQEDEKFESFKNSIQVNLPVIFLGGAGKNVMLKFSKILKDNFEKDRSLNNVIPIYMNTMELDPDIDVHVTSIIIKSDILNGNKDTNREIKIGEKLFDKIFKTNERQNFANEFIKTLYNADGLYMVSAIGGGFGSAFALKITEFFTEIHQVKATYFEKAKKVSYSYPRVNLYLIKPFNQEDSPINFNQYLENLKKVHNPRINIKEFQNDQVLGNFNPKMRFSDYLDQINDKIANTVMSDIINMNKMWKNAYTDYLIPSERSGPKNIKTIFSECYISPVQEIK